MTLDEIRLEIDAIDRKLIPLINKRMECSLEVARIKKAEGLPIYHPEREQQILDHVKQTAGEEYGDYVSDIYRNIMAISRALQNDVIDNVTIEATRCESPHHSK